jgi:hypothetical protein
LRPTWRSCRSCCDELSANSASLGHLKKNAGKLRDSPASSFSERRTLRPVGSHQPGSKLGAWSARHRESSIVVSGQVYDLSGALPQSHNVMSGARRNDIL